ncbi:uncharacterized protein ARMOST_22381 [Armillaria ostoyae]|uniref:Uncharacterized protein n=1 Tax=Armillaria ostoyae TaxID=47428 RepID=A0A284SCQ2_ARMOS|nr:uncharacterized protein ARMOST_22381 [Armillaria ostoyae]
MVTTAFPHDAVIVADAAPNNPDPAPTRIPPPSSNGQANWCRRLVTPVFEGAGDDGAHPRFRGCRRRWRQPFSLTTPPLSPTPRPTVPTPSQQKSPCPRLTARPTGAVFSAPPFSRDLEAMAPSARSLDAAIVPDAAPNDPDPIRTTTPTLV